MRRSRTLLASLLVLSCAILFRPTCTSAQTQGIPWYTIPLPIPNGFVDVATGNKHLEIPMASIPERNGDTLVLKAMWDTSVWGYNGGWGYSGPGWRVGAGTSHSGYGSWNSSSQDCVSAGYDPYDYGEVYYNYFYFVDNYGTSHSFGDGVYTMQVTCRDVNGIYFGSGNDIPSISGTAGDGSGYAFQVSNYTYLRVHAPDGTLVYDPYNTKYPVDTNGNYGNPGSVPDMLGRTPFHLPGSLCPNSTATVSASDGSTNTYTFTCTSLSIAQIVFGTQHTATEPFLTSIGLPDGTQYSFTYDNGTSGNHAGNLLSVTLPSGGVISFALISGGQSVTFGGGTWSITGAPNTPSQGQTTITVMSPLRRDSASNMNVSDKNVFVTGPNNLSYVQSAQYYSGSSTLVRTVNTTYSTDGHYLPLTVATTLNDTGQSSSVFYQYFNGTYRSYPTQKQETDFGGNVIRTTVTQYNASFMKPTSVNVYAGSNTSGTPLSSTLYFYDEYSANYCKNGVPGLTSVTGATNHDDTNYGSSFTARGNVTTIKRLISGTTYSITHMCYDTLGNVTQTVDANGNPTTYDYTDSGKWADTACIPSGTNTYAFPTTITDALGHQEKFTYFTCTSLHQSQRDQNDISGGRSGTTYTYDLLNRPLTINYPDGGQTTYCHSHDPTLPCYTTALPPFSTTARLMSGSSSLTTKTLLDGYGRVAEAQLTSDPDCPSGDKTDTTYDNFGRVLTVSNPYCATSDPTYGLTTYSYDALSRTTQVIPPDGSSSSNNISTTYSGNCTTVIDEAGKARKTCSDGLGRLAQVFEDPGSSPHLNLETDYTYDALDNLLTVNQKGGDANSANWRTRTFVYNSLSQLTSSTNPEANTQPVSPFTVVPTTYSYDANGNVLSKTSPAPNQTGAATVTLSYCYDFLNRMTAKAYTFSPSTPPTCSGTPPTFPSPAATFAYDETTIWGATLLNPIGRLTHTAVASTAYSALSYDPMGRVKNEWQWTPYNWNTNVSGSWPVAYTYDLAGDQTSASNGMGVTISYGYDAAARPNSVTSSFVDSQHPATLFTADATLGYFAHGALRKAALGNGLTLTNVYNNRLQPCLIDVNNSNVTLQTCNDSTPAGNVLDLWISFSSGYNYGTPNNGNVWFWNATGNQSFVRTFGYDALNRLLSENQTSGSATGCSSTFSLSWNYDAWGNRTDQNVTGGTCNAFHASVNSNNQLFGAPYQYDAAGDMTHDASHGYFYDAENRLIQVDGTLGTCSTASACYVYDALGRRVEKISGSSKTDFIYDLSAHVVAEWGPGCGSTCWTFGYVYLGGQLLAEYASSTTYFALKDHLGSTRLLTGMNQSVVQSLDYLPFGELNSSDSGTTSHKFTGKERDSESGLDNFGARFDSSQFGRFMSPDSPSYSSHNNPQSWNLYSYVQNNPINAVDPDGHDCVYLNDAGTAVENGDKGIDHNSNVQECKDTGGLWANGTVEHAWWVTTYSDSDNVRIFSHYKDIVGTTWAGPGSSHGDKYAEQWIPYAQAHDDFLAHDDGFQWAAWNIFFHSSVGAGGSAGESEDETPASAPVGRRGSNMSVGWEGGPPTNSPRVIGGRTYSGHSLDRLQGRGLTPTVVEEIIANGARSPGTSPDTTAHSAQGITIITNKAGDVVTVMYSRK